MALNSDSRAAVVDPAPLAWPNALDVQPAGRCKFTVSPPRHFLYPAVLLLLAEDPRHGYALLDALNDLGLGRMDRPAVYRTLADLEADGLILTWEEPSPNTGIIRHIHSITADGEQALESWMSVVAQERTSLDLVLQRYWKCNARRFPELGHQGNKDASTFDSLVVGSAAVSDPSAAAVRTRFEVISRGSSVVVEARSNVGPIAFSTTSVTGFIEVDVRDGLVQEKPGPTARLEVAVGSLSSGNALYDGELIRRVDARRFPAVVIELKSLTRMGEGNCYQVLGEVTIHGVSRQLLGVVTATVTDDRGRARAATRPVTGHLLVTGEYVLDVRHFDMEVPKMPLLKIYPDVRLHLRLEATASS